MAQEGEGRGTKQPRRMGVVRLSPPICLCTKATKRVECGAMGRVRVVVNRCDVCGHEWIRRGKGRAETCPRRECRSRRWNEGGGEGGDAEDVKQVGADGGI